jgi:hypothetical protein
MACRAIPEQNTLWRLKSFSLIVGGNLYGNHLDWLGLAGGFLFSYQISSVII